MTFKEWTEEWIEVYVKPHRRPNTAKCYQDTLNHLCRNFPSFVETEMNKVTGVQAQKVVNQMGEKYSKSLCKTTKVMMNQSSALLSKATCVNIPLPSTYKFLLMLQRKRFFPFRRKKKY